MSSERIRYAIEHGGLVLPDDGPLAVMGPLEGPGDLDRDRLTLVVRDAVAHAALQQTGLPVATVLEGRFAAILVNLPRARDRAEQWLAEAAQHTDLLIVDGAKTDGVEAIMKALKKQGVTLDGQVSKAHGRCLWMRPGDALDGWARPAMEQTALGDWVAPGVFSADAPDPASVALAAALPDKLKGNVADLGAGWGWLSREILKHESVKALHLVESDLAALDCARRNVTDSRAELHWADATGWTPPSMPQARLDAVVMNPPFHSGRKADPALGRAFITQAQHVLAPHGQLWMVANRHLPYETTLSELFREVSEIGGDGRFKILHAAKPSRQRR